MKVINTDGSSHFEKMFVTNDENNPHLEKDEVKLTTLQYLQEADESSETDRYGRSFKRTSEKLGHFSALGQLVDQFKAESHLFRITDSMKAKLVETVDALQGKGLSKKEVAALKTQQLDKARSAVENVALDKSGQIYTFWVI